MSVQQPTVRDVSLSASPPFVDVVERPVERGERLLGAFVFGVFTVTFGLVLPAYLMTVAGMGVVYALVLPPMAGLSGWRFGVYLQAYLTHPAVTANGGGNE